MKDIIDATAKNKNNLEILRPRYFSISKPNIYPRIIATTIVIAYFTPPQA